MIRPEDEPKINEMAFALRLSKEAACILLVSFNDELLRRDVEAELKRRLEPEGFRFRELRVTEDMYRNIPIVLVTMKPQPEDIFLIYDLRKAVPKEYYDLNSDPELPRPEVLDYLNYRREDFVEHNISAIFWLDEPTLTLIARRALDFYAFRSLPVFEFNVDRSQDMVIPGRTTPSEIFIYDSLEELNNRISLREEMLNDYLEKRPESHSTIADLNNELGILYYRKSQYDKAMAHIEEALRLYRMIKDKRGEADTLGNMGGVYQARGSLGEALDYMEQALEIVRKIGDVEGEATQLSNVGLVYQAKGDLNKALECYSKALEIDHRIRHVRGEAIRLINIGLVYQAKGDLNKALECYSKALEIDHRIEDVQGEANVLGNMGLVYRAKGDLDKALELYSQALKIDRRIGDAQGEATQLGNMGEVYYNKGNLDKALDFTKEALRIFVPIGGVMYADIFYGNLRKIIEKMKTVGIELSEENRAEIAELTEEYEKLKEEMAGVASS